MNLSVKPVTTTKMKVANEVKGGSKTIGTADKTHPLRYQDDDAWVTNWLFYSNDIMEGGTAEYVFKVNFYLNTKSENSDIKHIAALITMHQVCRTYGLPRSPRKLSQLYKMLQKLHLEYVL